MPQHKVDVRVCDQLAVRVDRVGVAGLADLGAVDRVDHRPEVDVGHDHARARRLLGERHHHVRPRILRVEEDAAEVLPAGARSREFRGVSGAVVGAPACLQIGQRGVELVGAQGIGVHARPAVGVEVGEGIDGRLAQQHALEGVVPIRSN